MDNFSIEFGFKGAYLLLLLAFIGSFLIAYFLYKKDQRIGGILKKIPPLKYTLISLRALSLWLVILMLTSPSLLTEIRSKEVPKIIFLNDNSLSIKQQFKDSTSQLNYQSSIESFLAKTDEKFQTIALKFGSEAKELDFSLDAKTTNIAKALNFTKEVYQDQNIAAVIMASDGINNFGKDPLYADQLNVPHYYIGIGDTTQKKDISLKNVIAPELIFLRNLFEIKVEIEGKQINEPAELKIIDKKTNQTLHQETILKKEKNFLHKTSFIIEPKQVGINEYIVKISPLTEEENIKNNELHFLVDVIDGKQRIDIVYGNTSPDINAISRAIETNENFQVKTTNLKDYRLEDTIPSLLILMNPNKNTTALKKILLDLKRHNIALLCFLSNNTQLQYLKSANTGNIHNSIGQLNFKKLSENEVIFSESKGFNSFKLSQETKTVLEQLPAISGLTDLKTTAPNSETLIYQKIGKIATKYPLLFFQEESNNKLGFFLGGNIWKWRLNNFLLSDNHDATNELITKTIQFLANKSDKEKFSVQTSQKIYNETDDIILKSKLYNDNFELVEDGEITLNLSDEKGKKYAFKFGFQDGEYLCTINNLPPGKYQYSAECAPFNYKAIKGSFHVKEFDLELNNLVADHNLLRELAKQNNGKFFKYSDLDKLEFEINNLEKVDNFKLIKDQKELIDYKILFAIIILLLSSEWFIRKYLGGY